MRKVLVKRLLFSVLTLLIVLFVLFFLLSVLPGTPFTNKKLTPEQIATLNAMYGLDQPFFVQFLHYLGNMLTGNLGISYVIAKDVPVNMLLANLLPASLQIGALGLLIGIVIGLILGVVAALNHNTILDTLCTIVSVIGVSVPSYLFALGLSYTFGFRLHLFPLIYKIELPFQSSVLPAVALSLFVLATVARFTRTELLEVLNSDYILFAESKGLNDFRIITRHALRNALIPLITIVAPMVVILMTGSMVVEQIFSVPGVGQLLTKAVQVNDYSVTTALAFLFSAGYIAIMLVVDILYAFIDPRVRVPGAEKEGS
jgi:oligopeptide transport system permease protein